MQVVHSPAVEKGSDWDQTTARRASLRASILLCDARARQARYYYGSGTLARAPVVFVAGHTSSNCWRLRSPSSFHGCQTGEKASPQAHSHTHRGSFRYCSRHAFADLHCFSYHDSYRTDKCNTFCQSDSGIDYRQYWWQSKANARINSANTFYPQRSCSTDTPRSTKGGGDFPPSSTRHPERHGCWCTSRGWWTGATAEMATACEEEVASKWRCSVATCACH